MKNSRAWKLCNEHLVNCSLWTLEIIAWSKRTLVPWSSHLKALKLVYLPSFSNCGIQADLYIVLWLLYFVPGHLTSKSDVYSFGVVLLEMLTGRRSMDKNRPNGEHNLVEWARPCLGERRRFYRLIDPRLEGRFSIKGAQKAAQLASCCLYRDPKSRPLMSEVVEILKPLSDLKDMACSSPHFQALQAERTGRFNPNSRNGSLKLQSEGLLKNGQPTRSLSIPNGPHVSPYHRNYSHRSPKPIIWQVTTTIMSSSHPFFLSSFFFTVCYVSRNNIILGSWGFPEYGSWC